MIIAIILIIQLCTFTSISTQVQFPVIGVYTQDAQSPWSSQNLTYIASSYIKNLEMSGAQVIPLFYHYSQNQLQNLLGKLNGVMFPGGQMPITNTNQWTSNVEYILNYAMKQNLAGNIYPIWATCLGYQTLMYLTSGNGDNSSTLTEVKGQDGKTCALCIKNNDSKLLESLSTQQKILITNGNGLLFFHHKWSITLSTFNSNVNMNTFWNLISTSITSDNVEFISTVQAKQYPFYASQYHPQKNSYQWRVPANRTYSAITVEQKFINCFIKAAKINRNRFQQSQLSKLLIYNYNTTLTNLNYSFVQIYLFNQSNLS